MRTSPTILVAEDWGDIRDLITLWLKGEGYRVLEAADGREAVEVARRECPDLVIMDISMPAVDGISAMQRIREIEELCDVPIIACSAHSAQDWRDRELATGFSDYITKPIDFGEMKKALDRLLR
jgi:two-component system response regulator VanR